MSASFERGINAFREVLDAPIASFFSSCVHCGLCAEACLFYTETGDPKYTPIHKLEPLRRTWKQEYTLFGRLGKLVGLSKAVTDEELAEWSELVYDSCTLCGRCSMVCPVGNDIAYMVRKMREGMSAAGHAPEGVIGATKRTVTIGSPMGVKWPAVQAQIKHVQADTGLEIPVDQEGVEYMPLLSSMEIINFPEYLAALARIFKQAGVTWTLSSDAFEATNSGIQIGASDIAREIVSRIVNAAEKLKVKTVISPECGHAFSAIRWEGPNLMGRPFTFEVKHILEVLDELRRQGKLRTRGHKDIPLTFHDPCQIVRRGGVVEQPRNLLNMVATDFREMNDHGVMNWCCGGGGGVSANERAEELRLKAFKRKKSQLEELGVTTMVTACANCRIVLEEGLEHYNMDVEVLGLTELLADYLVEDEESDPVAKAAAESTGA
ncbi:(Fe-S)-binding protein [Thioalbus denitrificans]|uniref:Fe-S oxidoreductase n=1 Tax=Thioalbus denitrificans TaxID=547122 RepID=A0A369C1J9_9GAMM|nr:(Fe-S)-binding protein [Thioalbus denitrificans]RCX26547.1 Fe-S oxidoreductase [Thioalbus denitrificans]